MLRMQLAFPRNAWYALLSQSTYDCSAEFPWDYVYHYTYFTSQKTGALVEALVMSYH